MTPANVLQQMFRTEYRVPYPGNGKTLRVDRQFSVCPIVTTGASESLTVAAPTKAGLRLTIIHDTDGGDVSVTVTGGYDAAGNTIASFYAAGDYLCLLSVKIGATYRWQVVSFYGVYGPESPTGLARYASNASLIAGSLSPMWQYCPSPADPRYDSLVHEYFNDFADITRSLDVTNDWTVYETDAGNTQAQTADSVCGEVLLTNGATDDNSATQIMHKSESFKLVSGKKLWFEARFKTAAGATQIDWAIGLIEGEDLTAVTNNMPANGIVFKKDDGDTNIDISSSDNGTDTEGAALGTWDTSYHILGFYFNGGATGAGTITPYIDRVAGTAITITYATMAELAPTFMVRNGDATTTQTMTIDYVKVVQMR